MVGFSPYRPQARTGFAVLNQTYEQWTPPDVAQGVAPDSEKSCSENTRTLQHDELTKRLF